MTYQPKSLEPAVSPVADLAYMRSEKSAIHPGKCICCPDEPTHVFAYNATIDGERFDYTEFVWAALRRFPDGTKFRITIAPVPVENAVCNACGWEGDADKLADQAVCPKCGQPELNFFTPGGTS